MAAAPHPCRRPPPFQLGPPAAVGGRGRTRSAGTGTRGRRAVLRPPQPGSARPGQSGGAAWPARSRARRVRLRPSGSDGGVDRSDRPPARRSTTGPDPGRVGRPHRQPAMAHRLDRDGGSPGRRSDRPAGPCPDRPSDRFPHRDPRRPGAWRGDAGGRTRLGRSVLHGHPPRPPPPRRRHRRARGRRPLGGRPGGPSPLPPGRAPQPPGPPPLRPARLPSVPPLPLPRGRDERYSRSCRRSSPPSRCRAVTRPGS